MPTPKKKVSKERRNKRRAHLALEAINFASCSQCGAPRLSHAVCESCGYYNGRMVPKKLLRADLRPSSK